MKVLITGADGQLAHELAAHAPDGVMTTSLSHEECDVTDSRAVRECAIRLQPEVVLNTAAFTAVEEAETSRDKAFAVNATGAANVARAASEVGATLIHFSTDYVFDGTQPTPYPVDATPRPLNVYGESKLEGERLVLQTSGDATIIRCGWIYSRYGRNFLTRILNRMSSESSVRVVDDQIGVPTSAADLADAVWKIVRLGPKRPILHWTNSGVASWYDFAVAITEIAFESDSKRPVVVPIRTGEFPTAVCRPAYSVLDARATWSLLGESPDHWRVALRRTLNSER